MMDNERRNGLAGVCVKYAMMIIALRKNIDTFFSYFRLRRLLAAQVTINNHFVFSFWL
jgi:hypothetical protein